MTVTTNSMPSCPTCHQPFQISPEEESLRNLIGDTLETGPVPPPTLCPDCRMQRRMARRNERCLYQRKCDLTGKPIIAIYPENAPFPVYERTAWWSDTWDALSYGRDFDFSRPFFEQFSALQNAVPRPSMNAKNVVNSDYSNFSLDSKNCYLSHCSYRSEDLLYCYWLDKSKNCIDCTYCAYCEQCLDCTDCNRSYNLRSSAQSHQCTDSFFLYDCRSCTECFGCVGLRHKTHYFFNESCTKEEYEAKKKKYDLQNPENLQEIQEKMRSLRLQHPHRNSIQEKTENCTGDYIFNAKNCQHCFGTYDAEDCWYIADVIGPKNCLDGYHNGWGQAVYDSYSPVNQQNSAFLSVCWDGNDNFYCDTCFGIHHSFGCIGLKHQRYCILNKKFSKEEYEKLLPKIVEHMKKTGEWGEFFPIKLSPFCYNETLAQEYYPLRTERSAVRRNKNICEANTLTKKEAAARGYLWRDPDVKEYKPQTYKTPRTIEEVSDTVLKEILACETCGKNFKIIAQELKIYREKKIALPKICPDCRHKNRLNLKNPRKLHHRNCMNCKTPITTTYAPDRKEIVYCEKCYLEKMY